MSRLRVFVSGPISRGDLLHNLNQATAAFVELAKAGLAPHCPHWSVYSKPCYRGDTIRFNDGGTMSAIPDCPVVCEATVQGNDHMGHADWIAIDLAWVEVCDVLLRLPGESLGAEIEVGHALALGKPVFHSAEAVVCYARCLDRYTRRTRE